uniref:Calmodulin n=1 Tax=Mucochytrium quahogii TaxID=96639 RepID=A0A7S2RYL3_9STRA|mmetsp:Transcript_22012/g.48000  ORF Transcript_22012/g.48000 Transcript_22012/m.48000 type:complete len:175 (+) Transcript_22012:53-577(+)
MEDQNKPFSQNEEKELHRVFNKMANFAVKKKIYEKLQPMKDHRDKILAHRNSPDTVIVFDENQNQMQEDEIGPEYNRLKTEIAVLEKEINTLNKDPNRKIRPVDLNECLKTLGKNCSRKEIDDMIWEVDENLDGTVEWDEFLLTYQRNLVDVTGLEPCQLFNVVQFLLYDKDGR